MKTRQIKEKQFVGRVPNRQCFLLHNSTHFTWLGSLETIKACIFHFFEITLINEMERGNPFWETRNRAEPLIQFINKT